jgi:hypothetical protein
MESPVGMISEMSLLFESIAESNTISELLTLLFESIESDTNSEL